MVISSTKSSWPRYASVASPSRAPIPGASFGAHGWQVVARQAGAKAFRCYYLAESYAVVVRWKDAQALYERASKLMEDAMRQLTAAGFPPHEPEVAAQAPDNTSPHPSPCPICHYALLLPTK